MPQDARFARSLSGVDDLLPSPNELDARERGGGIGVPGVPGVRDGERGMLGSPPPLKLE